MSSHITVEPLSTVPEEACVRHIDELQGDAKQGFIELVDPATDADCIPAEVADLDVVKFTDYYRVDAA